jgi:hypothetical protein
MKNNKKKKDNNITIILPNQISIFEYLENKHFQKKEEKKENKEKCCHNFLTFII